MRGATVRGWISRRRRLVRCLVVVAVIALVLVSGPWLWTTFAARGHVHGEADAPAVDVVIVLGTEVLPDGQPSDRLAGRLETAAALLRDGRARVVLVSGDGNGVSGDEPAAMAAHLTGRLGVDPWRVVGDPFGLDTYDSCSRARAVYGVDRALVVTQSYHVSRAVALCRRLGLDVDGVTARCSGCSSWLIVRKGARDYLASAKAAWDAVRHRPPAVRSPANPGVQDALRRG
ncbi:SanA/YdcF family protein [Plantactinospora sp. WMMB334]|uniref:SanA/YdcF family protein n=1 Tax=Plantactinospora sp. WMMB334 TaxID=3404119 RepID=UPI003B931D71